MKELWAHQKGAVEFSRDKDSLALFMETGTGKSRTAIEIIHDKSKTAGRILKTLILTPQVVTFNWKKEFAQFSNVPNSQIIVLHGTGLHRVKQLTNTPSYFVVICNYESLLMDPVFNELKRWAPDVIVADESHRIKNPRALRTKRSVVLAHNAKHKLILSGTPITQNQSDLFSQFLFMDDGKTFGKNFNTFRMLYFEDKNLLLRKKNKLITWPNWIPKKHKEAELTDKVMSQAVAVKKDECLDLPPLIRQGIEVEMSAEQKRAYKQMKDDYITFINSKSFTAQLAVTKAMRLQQIASGFIMGEDDKFHSFKNTPREKALLDLLEDLVEEQKVIVWASWKANQEMIHQLLTKAGIEHRMLIGDQTSVQREQAMNDFRENEKVRVIVGSQAAGGIGVNLIEASASVYFSRSFNLEHDVQSEARNYRGGSERHKSITRYDLYCPGTIDEEITKALAAKLEIANAIIGGNFKV